MSADVNTILEVKGCGLMKRFLADKTPEIREWYKQQAAKYRHLYPCPMQNGWWGYKEHCARCFYAIKKPVDAGTSTGEGK